MDLIMLTLFAARERTLKDWTKIIEEVDSRFEVHHTTPDLGPPSNIIHIIWKG